MSAPVAQSVAHKVYGGNTNDSLLRAVPTSARTILDLGCGSGGNAGALAARGAIVDGVTLSEDEATDARRVCREVWVHNLEAGLPVEAGGPYDCCICSHVLEHICFPEALLAGLRQVLAPEGTLVVALPNLMFYKTRFALARGRFEYESGGIMDDTHFRWYTFESAQRLFARHGYAVVRAWAEGTFPLRGFRRVLPSVASVIDRLATTAAPGLFGWQLLYMLRPAPHD
jgi:2-polyprenyl-3-methyl-5-hydroxy-6-metoxy-1,4-benzoquinol methylase